MYDPGLFSRPSPRLGEPYVPDNPRDYREPYVPIGFHARVEPFRRTGMRVGIRSYNVALVLVLGICGVTVLSLCAPFAWWLGGNAVRIMDEQRISDASERTLAQVGQYLGIIGTVLILFRLCAAYLLKMGS